MVVILFVLIYYVDVTIIKCAKLMMKHLNKGEKNVNKAD